MTTTTSPTETELAQRWAARVASGQFSAAVQGTREVRVFGTSGDAPIAFPRIRSLAGDETLADVLDVLKPDERWALGYAEQVVTVHRTHGRQVFGIDRKGAGVGTQLRTFDPLANDDILIVSQITGG